MDINEPTGAEQAESTEFHEKMHDMAGKIRDDREHSPEKEGQKRHEHVSAELERIKAELKTMHTQSDTPDQITENLTAPKTEKMVDGGYLDAVDDGYKEQVAHLVQRAVSNSIPAAIQEAQKKNDPYLMDSFHDSLALFLHQKMRENNLL